MTIKRMKSPFGSVPVLFVVLSVVLAMVGLIWAHWYTSLNVEANVNTGNVGIHWTEAWTNDDGVVNDWDVGDTHEETLFENWGDESSADPSDFGDARYDKDVAACFAGGGDGDLYVDIHNGYPSYHCVATAGIENYGSVPIKAMPSAWTLERGYHECTWYLNDDFTDPLPRAGDEFGEFVDNDMNGEFSTGDVRVNWDDMGPYMDVAFNNVFDVGTDTRLYEECIFFGEELPFEELEGGLIGWGSYGDDGFVPELTGFLPGLFECGTQIDPGDAGAAELGFHIENAAQQNTTYKFSMHQEFVNWNEFDDSLCPGPIVEEGYAPNYGEGISARFRNLGNELFPDGEKEIYVGWGDLGLVNPGDRVDAHYTWALPDTYGLEVHFDGTDVTASVNGAATTYANVVGAMSCAVGDLDRMQFLVRKADPTGTVELNNLMLDGNPLGSFTSQGQWNVVGYDFSGGFTITADLVLDAPITASNEGNRVEFGIGCPLTP